jgi:hypothetical protein
MDRDTAVRTWRDVCGSDTVMAMGVVTGRMLEDFAARIEAAERERCAKLCDVIEDGRLPDGSPVAGMAGECAWAIREGIAA